MIAKFFHHCSPDGRTEALGHISDTQILVTNPASIMVHSVEIVHANMPVILALLLGLSLWPRRKKDMEDGPSGDMLVEDGLKLAMLGKLPEAVERFEQASEAGCRSAMLYYNWGLALSHLGEHVPACEMYLMATELDPHCVDAILNWGTSLTALGRHNEAGERFRQALTIEPGNADAMFNSACLMILMEKHEEAVDILEKALKANPEDPQMLYNAGICLRKLNRCEESAERLKSFVAVAGKRYPDQVERAKEILLEIR